MTPNSAVEFLLQKYSVRQSVSFLPDGEVNVNGKALPLLPWRSERRFIEFKNLVHEGYLKGLSTVRVCHIDAEGSDLYRILYREADICEWITGTRIREIFAIRNDRALNAIAKTDAGTVFTFELAATQSKTAPVIDKHEVIAEKGVICDRAVDTQVPQSSVYVLGSDGSRQEYTDVDAELYGMDPATCAEVRQAFLIARDGLDFRADAEHLNAIVAAARESVRTVENIRL